MYDPLGLSIGTANLIAASNGKPPVSRRAALTLYPHRAPKIGLPTENPGQAAPGVLMSGFVERIGDSVALVSGDGSAHDPDLLLVEALDAMVHVAGADPASSEITIAVPAYWKPVTVQALRNALRTHLGFVRSGMAPRLVSDAIASLTAAHAELPLAANGVVALLDFGGSGTSATLMSLAGDFELITPTMRYTEFSGNEIEKALLLKVFEELGHDADTDPGSTAAVGQLCQLEQQCRAAKERLSTDTVVEFAAELGGRRCTMRLTRDELGDLIQDRLSGFIYAFDDMLAHHDKRWTDLAAVVAVGGGASIPLVTERLSVHTRRPVVAPSQPAFAAATGALLLASRGDALDIRTRTSIGLLTAEETASDVIELPAGDVLVIDHEALTDRELAWSQTEYPGDVRAPYIPDVYDEDGPAGWSMRLNVIDPPRARTRRRLRFSQVIVGMCAVVAMTAIGGVAYTLTGIEEHEAPPAPTVAPVPLPPVSSLLPSPVPPPPTAVPPPPTAAPLPSSEPPPPPPPPPPPATVTVTQPAPVVVTTQPPVVTTRRPAPRPTITHPPTTTAMTTPTTQPPPPPPPPTTTTPAAAPPPPPPPPTTTPAPMTTEWIHLPLLPVPIPIPVPQSLVPPSPSAPPQQYPQYPGGGGYPQSPQYPGGGGYPQSPQYPGGGGYPQSPQYPGGSGEYPQNPYEGPGY